MRDFFDEYGILLVQFIGATAMIGFFLKLFWNESSMLKPIIENLLNAWIG